MNLNVTIYFFDSIAISTLKKDHVENKRILRQADWNGIGVSMRKRVYRERYWKNKKQNNNNNRHDALEYVPCKSITTVFYTPRVPRARNTNCRPDDLLYIIAPS